MRLMLEDIGEGTPRSGALKGQVCCPSSLDFGDLAWKLAACNNRSA
jgi:hypothetical protein